MLDEDANLYTKEELRSPDEVWRRRQAIRLAAREAFMQTQADDALKRALLGRPRTDQEIYEQGDYVYIFRVNKTTGGVARKRQNVGGSHEVVVVFYVLQNTFALQNLRSLAWPFRPRW